MLFTGLLAFALAGLASGCDFATGSQAESPRESEESGNPPPRGLLTRSVDGEDEMTAILRGTLELDPDRGCILLSGKPVVWPAETTVTTEPPELHLPGGLKARSGDTITGGGGEVPAARLGETSIRIEGDLNNALKCAPADSAVAVFTVRGDGITVSHGS